jgi:acyl-CoA synthetase (AMP-forming)/AMP-acid ligase II
MGAYDASTKTWYGPKVDRSEYNVVSFRDHVINSFKTTPEKIFQISDDEGTSLTYKETEALSMAIARNLTKFGVKHGDVVTMMMPNSTYVAPIAFGCFLNGIAVAPFTFRQGITPEGLENSLNIAKPKAIILEDFVEEAEMIMQVVSDMGLDCKIFTVGSDKKFKHANILPLCELLVESGEGESSQ